MIPPRFFPVVIIPQPPIECRRTAIAFGGNSDGVLTWAPAHDHGDTLEVIHFVGGG